MPFVPQQFGELTPGINGVIAAGTTQADATLIYNKVNVIVAAPDSSGVGLPGTGASQIEIILLNDTDNDVNVWPDNGGQVNDLGVDAAFVLAAGGLLFCWCFDKTTRPGHQWYARDLAGAGGGSGAGAGNGFGHGFSFWPNGTNFDSFPLNSGGCTAFGLYNARGGYASGMTVTRRAALGDAPYYSARVQRDSGDSSAQPLVSVLNLTQDQTHYYKEQRTTAQIAIACGDDFSPVGGAITVYLLGTESTLQQAIRTSTGFYSGDNVILDSTVIFLDPELRTASLQIVTPPTIRQLALMTTATPVGTAGAADWYQLESPEIWAGQVGAFVAPEPYQYTAGMMSQILPSWTGPTPKITSEARREIARGTGTSNSLFFFFPGPPGGMISIPTIQILNPDTAVDNEIFDMTGTTAIAAAPSDGGPDGVTITNDAATVDAHVYLAQVLLKVQV